MTLQRICESRERAELEARKYHGKVKNLLKKNGDLTVEAILLISSESFTKEEILERPYLMIANIK